MNAGGSNNHICRCGQQMEQKFFKGGYPPIWRCRSCEYKQMERSAPMNSDHAPTAEEQLPPLDREHTYYDPITSEDDSQCLEQTGEFEIRILREDQLLAALRENREKDARIAELEDWKKNVSSAIRAIPEFTAGQWGGDKMGWGFHFEMVNYCRRQREAAESKLRAVSDAIEGKLEGPLGARIRAIVEGK